jgi:hypothetical protein
VVVVGLASNALGKLGDADSLRILKVDFFTEASKLPPAPSCTIFGALAAKGLLETFVLVVFSYSIFN